ncbi:BZ3500_MvSof-1268-A1-R1_Chr5-2g08082 [Microbotryum saponariae]|uniref:BZ3500_MvSof-1268-A1-R1_Chr5-2g08082 protein n=1 Tax=Microbotryum saponariae TaxID=289078 RepID=A0A2X0MK70_9BASI|nr:BZ3500_MvSof-1268-A1-R1_Chr5-2g08082 [Microbotryum saponariae]SDA05951.1 BZ3501_MvSof-1269-A2-R1_Chr5-2g07904 [Microbotryum saponariae]
MPTALHLLSYVAGSGAFVGVLLSFVNGLLYLAEVIEEHAAQAKVMGQRIVWKLVIALLATMHLVDALPLYIAALGIFCHLVYLQNFSRSWPRISLISPAFILSCVLVIANHFVSLNYFSERARSTGYHGGRGANTGSRWSSAHLSHASNHEETFLDVATYFGVCVWLCPFFLFLSLSANNNVLPSKGDASSPASPVQSRPPSPALSKQSGGTTFLKTLISCLLGFVPQRDRRSKNDHAVKIGHKSTVGEVAHDTKPLSHARSTPKLESASPVMGSLRTGWNQPPGASSQGQRSVSGPAAMVGNRERNLHSRSAPGSPQNSPLASPLLGPSFNVNPFTTAFTPRSPPKPSRNVGPPSSNATLASGHGRLGPRRHTTDEGFGFSMAAVGSTGVAPITQSTGMGHSSPTPRRPTLPTSGFTNSSDLSVDTSPRRSSMPGNTPGLMAPHNPNRGPPPPAASSGMAFKITPVPMPNPTLPTMGQGTPPRPGHQRTNSLVTLTPTRPTHVRRQSVGAGSLDALTLDFLPSTPSPVRPQHSVTSNAHGVPSVSIGLGRPSTFVSFTS